MNFGAVFRSFTTLRVGRPMIPALILAFSVIASTGLISAEGAAASSKVSNSGAATPVAPTTPLSTLSDLVLTAATVGSAKYEIPGTDGYPVDTLWTLARIEAFKGTAPGTLSLRIHGGQYNSSESVSFSDQPTISPNATYLLFLKKQSDGTYSPTLGWHGVVAEDTKVQRQSEPNPEFARATAAPDQYIYNDSCTGASAGFSGFTLETTSSGAHMVWATNNVGYYYNLQLLPLQGSLDSAASEWNGVGTPLHLSDSGPTTASGYGPNNENVVSFGNIADPTTLAATAVWSNTSTGAISEFDIEVNQNDYNAGDFSTGTPSSTQYSATSTLLHELGHGIGFDHISDTSQIMYPCIPPGVVKTLGWGDQAGIVNFYPPTYQGYYLVDQAGDVYTLGGYGSWGHSNANFYGAPGASTIGYPSATAVSIDPNPGDLKGYWILASNGGVFAYGSALFQGSAVGDLCGGCTAVALTSTPTGQGYWVLGSDGGIFAFNAPFYGSASGQFGSGVSAVGMSAMPNGSGYWIVNNLGQVYAFGSAAYDGGGIPSSSQPARAISASSDGGGYWILGADGGVFAFGDATFQGSATGATGPVALSRTVLGNGYTVTGNDGSVYAFGSAFFSGRGTTSLPPYYSAFSETEFPPDFSLSANPSSLSLLPGSSGNSTITVTGNPTFSYSVSFTLSGVPSGDSASITPSSVNVSPNGTATATLKVTRSALDVNSFTVTVTATSSSGIVHQTSVSVGL